MDFDRKSMSAQELTTGRTYNLKNALPLSINYEEIDYSNIKWKELVYYPYYYFEYYFKTSAGKSPSKIFQDSGFIIVDGVTRQIVNSDLLIDEIEKNPISNYSVRPENKYELKRAQRCKNP